MQGDRKSGRRARKINPRNDPHSPARVDCPSRPPRMSEKLRIVSSPPVAGIRSGLKRFRSLIRGSTFNVDEYLYPEALNLPCTSTNSSSTLGVRSGSDNLAECSVYVGHQRGSSATATGGTVSLIPLAVPGSVISETASVIE